MQLERRDVARVTDIDHCVAALGGHGFPQAQLQIYRQFGAPVGTGQFAAELEKFAGFNREPATVVMPIEIVARCAPDKRHGIAFVVDMHMPCVTVTGQLGHDADAVAEVAGKGAGVVCGDLQHAQWRVGFEAVRRHGADQIALHPQQFLMVKNVHSADLRQGRSQAFTTDMSAESSQNIHGLFSC
ncbi:hypothetical protein D3C78_1387740 [compost metagenome]